jgi:hypothetical protein
MGRHQTSKMRSISLALSPLSFFWRRVASADFSRRAVVVPQRRYRQRPNPAIAPVRFALWTLRDKAEQRRSPLR